MGAAVHAGAADARQNFLLEVIAQLGHPARVRVHPLARQLARFAEANNGRHILGARPQRALLPAAMHERRKPNTVAHEQRARALGSVDFVRREGKQRYAQCLHVDGHLAGGLHGIGVDMDIRAAGLGDRHDVGDRLERADVVVGQHD